jgi:hypothetical protein
MATGVRIDRAVEETTAQPTAATLDITRNARFAFDPFMATG